MTLMRACSHECHSIWPRRRGCARRSQQSLVRPLGWIFRSGTHMVRLHEKTAQNKHMAHDRDHCDLPGVHHSGNLESAAPLEFRGASDIYDLISRKSIAPTPPPVDRGIPGPLGDGPAEGAVHLEKVFDTHDEDAKFSTDTNPEGRTACLRKSSIYLIHHLGVDERRYQTRKRGSSFGGNSNWQASGHRRHQRRYRRKRKSCEGSPIVMSQFARYYIYVRDVVPGVGVNEITFG